MARLERFATGFVSTDHFEYSTAELRGRNWLIQFGPQTAGSPITSCQDGNRIVRSKEVFILAPSEIVARQVASDVVGAMTLLNGSAPPFIEGWDAPVLHNHASTTRLHAGTVATDHFPLACRIAVSASNRLRRQYALAKFRLSCGSASFPSVDLDPSHSETIPRWHRPEDHVRLAVAIVLAYSVLEELGLEIRASERKRSAVGGGWNPAVKDDLERRLSKCGVDLSSPVVWSVRGGKSRIEAKKPRHLHAASRRTPWARWSIRDRHVEVVDAIAHASFLRSRVSSHRLKPAWVRMLSAYDVSNVQLLARRLFLEALGFWPPSQALAGKYRH